MERKRHYAAERLSPQGRALVDGLLGENDTYEEIVKRLKAKTGEALAISSLQRYHAKKWFPTRQVLEETGRLHGLVKEALEKSQGKKLDEVSSELLKTHLFHALAATKDADPLKLYQLVISEGFLGVEKEKVSVQKERLGVMRERLKQLERALGLKEKQLSLAKENAEKMKGAIEAGADPTKVVEMIDKILGL